MFQVISYPPLFVLFSILSLIVHGSPPVTLMSEMVDWIRSTDGGFWNEKVAVLPLWEDSHVLGLFATQDIAENETIAVIPKECLIHIFDDMHNEATASSSQQGEHYSGHVCRLARKLQDEMALGPEASRYGPYVAYLQQQRRGQLPSTWSRRGQDLLRPYLPVGSNALDLFKTSTNCPSDTDPHWIAVTIQRGWDVSLVPLWDMVNHQNGDGTNTETSSIYANAEQGMRVWASKPIAAGEQLFHSYDGCSDCHEEQFESEGTTELLRDFGFVEDYPQRWVYDYRGEDEGGVYVWFQVRRVENESEEKSQLEVYWSEEGEPTNKAAVAEFLRGELLRLQKIAASASFEDECELIPPHECETIRQYRQAALKALILAVDSLL